MSDYVFVIIGKPDSNSYPIRVAQTLSEAMTWAEESVHDPRDSQERRAERIKWEGPPRWELNGHCAHPGIWHGCGIVRHMAIRLVPVVGGELDHVPTGREAWIERLDRIERLAMKEDSAIQSGGEAP